MSGKISRPLYPILSKRFLVQQNSDQQVLFLSDTAIPTTNIDDLMRRTLIQQTSGSTTTRVDNYVVPNNKIWRVKTGVVDRATPAGALFRVIISGITAVVSAPASANPQVFACDFTLGSGDTFQIEASTATSGAINTNIIYEELDA